MSRNSTPLTTRPASTSRHGMMRLKCTRLRYLGQRRERLGHREAPLVQRLADYHPVERVELLLGAQRRDRLQVLELADPAREDHAAVAGRARRHRRVLG